MANQADSRSDLQQSSIWYFTKPTDSNSRLDFEHIMASDTVILSALGVAVTTLGVVLGAIYYRLSNLETRREREEYLKNKFKDRKWAEQPLVAEFDTLHVTQKSGVLYKLKRYLFGSFDGSTIISVNTNFGFPEEMWEHEGFMKPYHKITNAEVDLQKVERLNTNTVQVILEVESVEHNEISHSVISFLGLLKKADETVDGVELGWKQFE